MWTKNGKILFTKQLSTSFTNKTSAASNFTFKASTGDNVEMQFDTNISGVFSQLSYIVPDITATPSNTSSGLSWQLYIGTGTTLPTEDDYTLEAPVTFTCPVLPQISRGSNYTTLLITYTFTNNTDAPTTITEIGLSARVKASSQNNPAVLFNRRLLETPVTMNVGDNYTFTFTIDTSNLTE